MSKISFKDPETNSLVKLGPLPFNLQCNHEEIEHYLGLHAWHKWGNNSVTTLGYHLKCGLSVKIMLEIAHIVIWVRSAL